MRSREEDSLVERDVIRAGCQWQPQLSKKRDFFPAWSPMSMCHAAFITEIKGRGTRHAQDPLGPLGMIAEPTGTDGQRTVGRSPRSPRAITHRSPLSTVLLSLRSQANGGDAAVPVADLADSPLSVQKEQRRPGPDQPRRGIPPEQWPDVLRRVEQGDSLRQIVMNYGVSYETVRRTIKAAHKREQGRPA